MKFITFADADFFAQNRVKSKKEKVNTSACRSLSCVSMFWHVFTVQNAEMEGIWAFFSVLG